MARDRLATLEEVQRRHRIIDEHLGEIDRHRAEIDQQRREIEQLLLGPSYVVND